MFRAKYLFATLEHEAVNLPYSTFDTTPESVTLKTDTICLQRSMHQSTNLLEPHLGKVFSYSTVMVNTIEGST